LEAGKQGGEASEGRIEERAVKAVNKKEGEKWVLRWQEARREGLRP
jgi:hypothetical protein